MRCRFVEFQFLELGYVRDVCCERGEERKCLSTRKSTFSWWMISRASWSRYEAILNELNENLIKARSGKEALDHLLKTDIAVVLMDVSMPELDGFELADMIRQHPRFQNTAIIFISAVHLTDIDRLKAYQRGAVDYISVPIVPGIVARKSERVCGPASQDAVSWKCSIAICALFPPG